MNVTHDRAYEGPAEAQYTTADREPTAFENLRQGIGELEDVIAALSKRLAPVLRPDYESAEPGGNPVADVSDLRHLGGRVYTARRNLADLAERLEV